MQGVGRPMDPRKIGRRTACRPRACSRRPHHAPRVPHHARPRYKSSRYNKNTLLREFVLFFFTNNISASELVMFHYAWIKCCSGFFILFNIFHLDGHVGYWYTRGLSVEWLRIIRCIRWTKLFHLAIWPCFTFFKNWNILSLFAETLFLYRVKERLIFWNPLFHML